MKKIYCLSIALLVLLLPFKTASAQIVNINLNKTHQIIRGFGGMHTNAWQGTQLNEDMRKKAFDNDPGEIGLSIFRMRVDPNQNNWGVELPVAQYALSKGAIVFASPWNPPTHMHQLLRETEHGTDYVLLPEYYDDYVNHLNDYIDYMGANGVPLYALSVQNEPDWHGWTVWTPEQMLKFVRENAKDIKTKVIAPESLGYLRKMSDPLLNDPVANANIDILGTHLYGTPKENIYYPLAYEKKKEIWMTEHLYGSGKPEDNTWALAMKLAEEINTTMDANMSAFVYWYIRRFYGLIDELGNITDKGYVMSQFAKFVEPGAMRVEVENFHAGDNVNVTAYKTDTSFVMVVVNNGFNSASLTFNIPGAGFEKLTQFTTSASKKVANDGETAVAGGSFSVSVDAQSITTFTTHPAKGGKYGNKAPVAAGGADLQLVDETGAGEVEVTLKGSESQDADGEIVNYSWAKDGVQIAWEADPTIALGIGNHTLQLTVTDNDGARNTTAVKVSVVSLKNSNVWLEAECTEAGANWNVHTGQSVSNGKYLSVKPGTEATGAPSANSADHLVYNFTVTEGGNFKVWGRTLVPSANDDSFWVRMDEGEWVNWNGIKGGSTWQWDDVHDGSGNAVVYALESGEHKLTVCYREDGAGVDKFYITNTGLTPSELGSDAVNCETVTGIFDGVKRTDKTVQLFPNPAKSIVHIESINPFSSIVIYTLNGSKVLEQTFRSGVTTADLPIDLDRGVYLLKVITDRQSVVKRLLVE